MTSKNEKWMDKQMKKAKRLGDYRFADIKKWELDPKKKYVLFVPCDVLSRLEMLHLAEVLKKEGIKGIIVSVISTKGIKVIEQK